MASRTGRAPAAAAAPLAASEGPLLKDAGPFVEAAPEASAPPLADPEDKAVRDLLQRLRDAPSLPVDDPDVAADGLLEYIVQNAKESFDDALRTTQITRELSQAYRAQREEAGDPLNETELNVLAISELMRAEMASLNATIEAYVKIREPIQMLVDIASPPAVHEMMSTIDAMDMNPYLEKCRAFFERITQLCTGAKKRERAHMQSVWAKMRPLLTQHAPSEMPPWLVPPTNFDHWVEYASAAAIYTAYRRAQLSVLDKTEERIVDGYRRCARWCSLLDTALAQPPGGEASGHEYESPAKVMVEMDEFLNTPSEADDKAIVDHIQNELDARADPDGGLERRALWFVGAARSVREAAGRSGEGREKLLELAKALDLTAHTLSKLSKETPNFGKKARGESGEKVDAPFGESTDQLKERILGLFNLEGMVKLVELCGGKLPTHTTGRTGQPPASVCVEGAQLAISATAIFLVTTNMMYNYMFSRRQPVHMTVLFQLLVVLSLIVTLLSSVDSAHAVSEASAAMFGTAATTLPNKIIDIFKSNGTAPKFLTPIFDVGSASTTVPDHYDFNATLFDLANTTPSSVLSLSDNATLGDAGILGVANLVQADVLSGAVQCHLGKCSATYLYRIRPQDLFLTIPLSYVGSEPQTKYLVGKVQAVLDFVTDIGVNGPHTILKFMNLLSEGLDPAAECLAAYNQWRAGNDHYDSRGCVVPDSFTMSKALLNFLSNPKERTQNETATSTLGLGGILGTMAGLIFEPVMTGVTELLKVALVVLVVFRLPTLVSTGYKALKGAKNITRSSLFELHNLGKLLPDVRGTVYGHEVSPLLLDTVLIRLNLTSKEEIGKTVKSLLFNGFVYFVLNNIVGSQELTQGFVEFVGQTISARLLGASSPHTSLSSFLTGMLVSARNPVVPQATLDYVTSLVGVGRVALPQSRWAWSCVLVSHLTSKVISLMDSVGARPDSAAMRQRIVNKLESLEGARKVSIEDAESAVPQLAPGANYHEAKNRMLSIVSGLVEGGSDVPHARNQSAVVTDIIAYNELLAALSGAPGLDQPFSPVSYAVLAELDVCANEARAAADGTTIDPHQRALMFARREFFETVDLRSQPLVAAALRSNISYAMRAHKALGSTGTLFRYYFEKGNEKKVPHYSSKKKDPVPQLTPEQVNYEDRSKLVDFLSKFMVPVEDNAAGTALEPSGVPWFSKIVEDIQTNLDVTHAISVHPESLPASLDLGDYGNIYCVVHSAPLVSTDHLRAVARATFETHDDLFESCFSHLLANTDALVTTTEYVWVTHERKHFKTFPYHTSPISPRFPEDPSKDARSRNSRKPFSKQPELYATVPNRANSNPPENLFPPAQHNNFMRFVRSYVWSAFLGWLYTPGLELNRHEARTKFAAAVKELEANTPDFGACFAWKSPSTTLKGLTVDGPWYLSV